MSTATPPVNTLIWLSVKPMIKLVVPAACGFALTRAQMFSLAGSRSAAQIILNVTLPALLFSKIIPSFTPENIKAIGPIILVALVYLGLSMTFGLLVKALFPCPRNFRWGILSAATWSNWGDLPTSVVQTVTLTAPFAGIQDSNLAIAYVSIFILVFYVTLFPLRGVALIQWDYTRPPKDEDEAAAVSTGKWWRIKEVQRRALAIPSILRNRKLNRAPGGLEAGMEDKVTPQIDEKVAGNGQEEVGGEPIFPALHRITTSRQSRNTGADLRRLATVRSIGSVSIREMASAAVAPSFEDTDLHARRLSESRGVVERERELSKLRNGANVASSSVFDEEVTEVGTEIGTKAKSSRLDSGGALKTSNSEWTAAEEKEGEWDDNAADRKQSIWTTARILQGFKNFLLSLVTPPTIALVTSLICAVVNDLKCLFVVVPGSSFHPTAPDNDPPFAILLDTATFLGNASVPLGLLVLGSALARMRVPKPFSRLPLGSIVALAICKLVLLPIFGFFFVDALVKHTSLVDEENRVLRFVLIYFSCVPTATTQVALTQIYAPEDGESNSDILASYLIAQYSVFAISSVFLTSFTLKSLF